MNRIEMGKKIKEIRLSRKISLEELAHRLGYAGASSVCKWETGIQGVPQEKLELLAKELGVPVSEFTGKPIATVKLVPKEEVINKGDIWVLRIPGGEEQLMLVLGSGSDSITGFYIQDDLKAKVGSWCVDILGGFFVDVSTIHSKPRSYAVRYDSSLSADEWIAVRDKVAEYIGVKTEIQVVEKEKIVTVKEDTAALERQVLELKAKLYDMMTA